MSKYQLFDALTSEEYNSLRESIIAVGVRVPIVICGDTGEVIDGHHRLKICEEQGRKDYPVEKVYGLSELEKRQMARSLNMARRHLTQEQRRKQIQDQLRDTPELSDRAIAASIGVTNKTVGHQRREMVRREEIPHIEKTVDTLGREQPRKPVGVINPTARQERLLNKPAVIERMASDNLSSPVIAMRKINKERIAARECVDIELSENDVKLLCLDIRTGLPEIPDNSVDAIITDAPYERDYIELYSDLSRIAARVLRDGSPLIVMTGQSHLPEVIQRLGEHMSYNWCLSYQTPAGGSMQNHNRKTFPYWKPVLWYIKGKLKSENYVYDVITAPPADNEREKYHPHEQSVEGFKDIIRRFTKAGDTILDCFAGSGTTGVAAVRTGRKFIGCDISKEHISTAKMRIADALNAEQTDTAPTNGNITHYPVYAP